ncbi:hypothetical protein Vafri_14830, partial [Volvox africanus]
MRHRLAYPYRSSLTPPPDLPHLTLSPPPLRMSQPPPSHSAPHHPHSLSAHLASRPPTPGLYPGSCPQRVARNPRGLGIRVAVMTGAVEPVARAAIPAEEGAAPDPPPTPACEPHRLLLHPPSRSPRGASTDPLRAGYRRRQQQTAGDE